MADAAPGVEEEQLLAAVAVPEHEERAARALGLGHSLQRRRRTGPIAGVFAGTPGSSADSPKMVGFEADGRRAAAGDRGEGTGQDPERRRRPADRSPRLRRTREGSGTIPRSPAVTHAFRAAPTGGSRSRISDRRTGRCERRAHRRAADARTRRPDPRGQDSSRGDRRVRRGAPPPTPVARASLPRACPGGRGRTRVLVVTAGNALGRRLDLADELVIGRRAERGGES